MTSILAVSHTPVWPIRSGSSVRRLMTLEALREFGTLDLLYVGEVDGWAAQVPVPGPVRTALEHPVARRRLTMAERTLWAALPRRPLQAIEWSRPRSPVLPRSSYDLVWYFRPLTFALAGRLPADAAVVDLDDLEDRKLTLARGAIRRDSARRRFAERRNIVGWERFQRDVSRRADAVTVCTEEDREALGADNCYVLPNGFPSMGMMQHRKSDPFTMLFVALFEYEPNADAAEFMVERVLPAVRTALPMAELRLVGRTTPRIERLARPGVVVVGEVPDLASEYARATTALAPIRFGGGTRVKIIEAFARNVPVVSTAMGAAGLGVVHGEHLLMADDALSFAAACVSMMSDGPLRAHLARNAHAVYEQRFSQEAITHAVGNVVVGVSPRAGR